MRQNWIGKWTQQDIELTIVEGDDLLEPFTIHHIIKKINNRFPRANASYTCDGRRIRQALNRLVSVKVLSEAYSSVKRLHGSITEINYSFIYVTESIN